MTLIFFMPQYPAGIAYLFLSEKSNTPTDHPAPSEDHLQKQDKRTPNRILKILKPKKNAKFKANAKPA